MKIKLLLALAALSLGLLTYGGYQVLHRGADLSLITGSEAPTTGMPSSLPPTEDVSSRAPAASGARTLVLSSENTISFNEVVTEESVAKFEIKLKEMSSHLRPDQDIILVMHTPGGSVDAGMHMIDSIKAVPQKVKTLTLFAASMGFQIVQNADARMITPSGVLMSHRAKGDVEGEFGGELDSRLNTIRRGLLYLDIIAAKRMQLTLAQYRTLIADEYWVYGFDAVSQKAADTEILARCDSSFVGNEVRTFDTIFGAVDVVFSKCPLITGPLEIKLQAVAPDHKEEVREYVKEQYDKPNEFVLKWMNNNKYLSILKH